MVWHTPTTLQIGVDPPLVVIDDLSESALLLLEGLRTGVTVTGAAMIAKEAGMSAEESQRLMAALGPVLQEQHPAPPLRLELEGNSTQHAVFSQHWRALGHHLLERGDNAEHPAEMVILANYVVDPALYRRCLTLDRVHTPVVFRDQSVVIGPRITPGLGPCLHCLWLNETKRSPHHHAMMSQLWQQRAPSDTPDMALIAAWQVLSLLEQPQVGRFLRVDTLTREVTEHTEESSPECLCRDIQGN
jgi:hypothetical protein